MSSDQILWSSRHAVIATIMRMFPCLTVTDVCMIYSVSRSLFSWNTNRALYLLVGVTGCLIAIMNRPPNMLDFVGISVVLKFLNTPRSKSPLISSSKASLLAFEVYRRPNFCFISEGSSVASWYVRQYRST